MASTSDSRTSVQQRQKVVEEINLLRSGLLDDEFEWSLLSAHDEQLWQSALLDTSPSPSLLLSLPFPDFSLSLSESPSIHLSVQYRSFSPSLPALAIHATSLSRADQASLNEELERLVGSAEAEEEEYHVFSIFSAIREHIAANPPSAPPPPAKALPKSSLPSSSGPNELKLKTTLLWSHHLLATGKRKNIVAWASELQLWGISRPGYPGVIIVEGLVQSVEEFVWRIKQLNWKALQVRCEVDGFVLGADDCSSLGEKERIEWALREKSCLGKVLGGEGEKIGVKEVAELGQVGDLMTRAGLEEVFRTAMKL